MAGLLNDAATTSMRQGTGLMAEEDSGPTEDEVLPLSPEEQKVYENVVQQGKSLIYDKSTFDSELEKIKSTADGQVPFDGLSDVLAMTLTKLKMDSQKAGIEVSDEVMWKAGARLNEELTTAAMEAGIFTKDYPQGYIDGSYTRGINKYREMLQQAGLYDENKYKALFQGMIQSDKEGTLLSKLGLNRADRRAMKSFAGRA